MKKHYILIAILVLLLAAFIYLFGMAETSVVPGWHTTIYPTYYVWVLIVLMTLFFGTIGYWLYVKQINKLNWALFIIYFLVTTSTYVFLKFPSIFLTYQKDNQEGLFTNIYTILKLLPVARWVLISTQILFVIYAARIFIIHRRRTRLS